MMMIKRLRYLLSEGFDVENVSGYDPPAGSGESGRGSITYVELRADGGRRLHTEEFLLGGGEAKRCAILYHRSFDA